MNQQVLSWQNSQLAAACGKMQLMKDMKVRSKAGPAISKANSRWHRESVQSGRSKEPQKLMCRV